MKLNINKTTFFKTILILLCLSLLTGCKTVTKLKVDTMTILPTKLSDDVSKTLNILGELAYFLDFYVDDSAKTLALQIWVYEDEKWVSAGKTEQDLSKKKNQIALHIKDDTVGLFHIFDTGFSKTEYDVVTNLEGYTMMREERIMQSTKIALDEEIVLWSKLATTQDAFSTSSSFRDSNCDAGIAITATFSSKSLQ